MGLMGRKVEVKVKVKVEVKVKMKAKAKVQANVKSRPPHVQQGRHRDPNQASDPRRPRPRRILPSVIFRNRRTRLVESVRPWLPRAVLAPIPLPACHLLPLPVSQDCLVRRSPRHASRRRRHAHKVQRRGNQLRLTLTSSCQAVILQQRRELRRVLLRQRRALILQHKVTWLHPAPRQCQAPSRR